MQSSHCDACHKTNTYVWQDKNVYEREGKRNHEKHVIHAELGKIKRSL